MVTNRLGKKKIFSSLRKKREIRGLKNPFDINLAAWAYSTFNQNYIDKFVHFCYKGKLFILFFLDKFQGFFA